MKLSQLSLADYNQLDSIPVINQDLSASGFTPVANTYYKHIGTTTDLYTQGVIYYYNGTGYVALDGSAAGLATVAKTGSYNDLLDKPTIPAAANNGTLTIQKNGTTVQTFTANQSSSVTANITVPTKVGQLENDTGFTTNEGTITGINMNGASKGTSGVVDIGTVLTDASKFATAAQGTKADNAMPKAGGTFTGDVIISSGYSLNTNLIKSADDTKRIAEITEAGLEIGGSGTPLRLYSSTRPVHANENKELAYTSDIPTDYVPNTRKVNNKALSSDITLGASDVGALPTSGGTVTGNLTVGGNLTINGTTTTVDSTTLQVKDKLIEVAHGNTTTLTTPAGLVAPKYDGTNSGALVFDSTGKAYVGDVTLKDGNIDVANSDLQPLATRTGLVGGNLVQYDSSAQTLNDSGKKISDLALKTDIPTDYVKYTAQTLTDAQKSQARSNIGAGTSSFSGNYSDLQNIPTDIAKIGNLSNPNLLINPNFAINQRRQTSYTGAVYGVDRWQGQTTGVTVTTLDNGIRIAGQDTGIWQKIETNLSGQTVTASCKISAINSGVGGLLRIYYRNASAWTLIGQDVQITAVGIATLTVTIPNDALYVAVFIGSKGNSDVVFEWAKLEIGSVATEFSPPNIADELPKCQRYYIYYGTYIAAGYVTSGAKNYTMPISLTVPMRVLPTMNDDAVWVGRLPAGGYCAYTGSEYKGFTSKSVGGWNAQGNFVRIVDTVATAFDPNNSIISYTINNLALDAEI